MKRNNIWLKPAKGIEVWAHQGGALEAPSSTLFAARRAITNGATAIEWDVHRTKDGHFVICHDATVDRTTNGSGAIVTMNLAELKRLDPAYWFVREIGETPNASRNDYRLRGSFLRDESLRFLTVDEYLQEFPLTRTNYDLKAPGYEEDFVTFLGQRGALSHSIVASFERARTTHARAKHPNLQTSIGRSDAILFSLAPSAIRFMTNNVAIQVPPTARVNIRKLAREFRARGVDEDVARDLYASEAFYAGNRIDAPASLVQLRLGKRHVRAAHNVGMAVHAWTINHEAEMLDLIELGVDGIMTDRPSVLAEVVERSAAERATIHTLS